MIYDLKGHWDDIGREWVINLGKSTNITIIIDDTFMFSDDKDTIFTYLKEILEISKHYNLSWKLDKCEILTPHFEFAGIDIDDIGNCPALSKGLLLEIWKYKKPKSTRDCASFIGLVGLYRGRIPFC